MKQFTILSVAKEFDFSNITADLFQEYVFVPCLKSQESSVGFGTYVDTDPQTGEDVQVVVKKIQQYLFLTLIEEKKKLPSSKEHKLMVSKRLDKIEQEGQELTDEVKIAVDDAVRQEAINRAFSSTSYTDFIIDTQEHKVYAGCNLKKAENVSSLLREVLGSFPVTPLVTNLKNNPAEFYTHIVNPEVHHDLMLGTSVSFAHPETGAIHSIKKQELDSASAEIEPLLDRHFLVTEIQLTDAVKFEATYVVNTQLEFKGVKHDILSEEDSGDANLLLTAEAVKMISNSLVGYIEAV